MNERQGSVDEESCWDMVFMEGFLKKHGRKRKKRHYYVLHQNSNEWQARLDCFESLKNWENGLESRKTVYLSDLFNVVDRRNKKFPNSFVLFTNQEKIVLTAHTEKEKLMWINVIEFNRRQQSDLAKPVKEERRWNVQLKKRQILDSPIHYEAIVSSSKIDFIDGSDDIAFSIPMETITKYGYTENSCYFEVNCSVSLGDTSLIDGSSIIWLKLENDQEAESFIDNIIEHKKNRPRSNTEKRPSLRPNDFKRSLSHSDLLEASTQSGFQNNDISSKSSVNNYSQNNNINNNNNNNNNYNPYTPSSTTSAYGVLSFETSQQNSRSNDYVSYSSAQKNYGMNRVISFSCDDSNVLSDEELSFKYDDDDDVFNDGDDNIADKGIHQHGDDEISQYSSYSIRDHLLQRTGHPTLSKSSTSSSLADDELDINEKEQDQTNKTLKETFVKLNFNKKRGKQETTTTLTTTQRKKQNRVQNRKSRETVEVLDFLSSKKEENTNKEMSKVSLVGFRTKNNHFQEPHYEAIRDLAIKGALKPSSNTSTPETSPKLYHNRTYVLKNGFPIQSSPNTKHKKKKNKHPVLSKRNTSNFYIDSTDVTSQREHRNMNNTTKSKPSRPKIEHAYSEISTRPRRSLNSSEDGMPMKSFTPCFPKKSYGNLIDYSKSDGELSDSDILDVPRHYNRRRSKTGNAGELPDPNLFYAVPNLQEQNKNYKHYQRKHSVDYVETLIKPRPSIDSISSQPTYENNALLQHDYEEPTYASPDINITSTEEEQPAYENNGLLHNKTSPSGYTYIRPSSLSFSSDTESNYNNISFNKKESLQYANIDLQDRRIYDNLSSSEDKETTKHSRVYSTNKGSGYTQIDFQKSEGLKEALNQLRSADNYFTPELNTEYKIDLSHIKFTKSPDIKRNSIDWDKQK